MIYKTLYNLQFMSIYNSQEMHCSHVLFLTQQQSIVETSYPSAILGKLLPMKTTENN